MADAAQLPVQDKYRQPEVIEFWRRLSLQGLQACEEAAIKKYASAPGLALDLGCGSGRAILALQPRGYRVVGLDITWEMLDAARELCAQRHLQPHLTQGDLRALPYAQASFDLALILIAALQHIPQRKVRQAVLADIARVLRPGGVLILALDNLAPALRCYGYWGLRKLGAWLKPSSHGRPSPASSPGAAADQLLSARRASMNKVIWHLRGLARTLRWRTWNGWVDAARRAGLAKGEPGDAAIHQVSLTATRGRVYYHIYRHAELVADAQAAGLELLGYHACDELTSGRETPPRIRQLDKQILYAFRRPSK
ncbi:MAG: class I SAM-dependent methyltransferase [Chloroflexi bacterium]|nr:class I SAM-dependent methyltransferase [Chloroflexota bacterium]